MRKTIQTEEFTREYNIDNFNDFEKFFELSPDLLCVAGFDGFFKKINPAVSKLLGYSNEELLSKPINHFVYYDDQNETEAVRNKLRKRIPLTNFENRYLTKNGGIVWLLWTSLPIEKDNLIYAIAKNITHKRELEEERNLQLVELIKMNNEFKQLTYTTAHDLRSPVNNLLAVFELLDTSSISDDETLEYISILKTTSEGLKQTLNDYVTVLNKKNELNAPIDVVFFQNALDDVLLSINSLILNSQATINIDFSALEKVNFNNTYLKSVFLNLITNSIKYSKHNELPIISIYSKINNGKKQLIVSDNGIGFDMENVKDRIFGLHQKFNNNSDSNGIGLYLVYNHITNLGGHIAVESVINEGAKFIITFKD